MMGTVKLNIAQASGARGVANPFALSRATGLNYAICYRLWHEQTTQISLPTMATLCDTLGCSPGDLLVYSPNSKTAKKGKK